MPISMEINFLKKKKKFKKGGSGIKPDRYWRYIIYITFALIAFFLVFGWYFFRQTSRELASSFTSTPQQEIVGEGEIGKVLQYFKIREDKSIEILNSLSPIIDPSL